MTPRLHRREFISFNAASLAALSIGAAEPKKVGKKKPVVIASGNQKTVEIAYEMVLKGADPLDAAIAGVAIVEADPNNNSVGLGGTPNEEGVVELDASVMHGPTHGGAGVAGLKGFAHPAAVARAVMKKTVHSLLVGDNAGKFAREHGFPEVDLLTDATRKAWIAWKEQKLRGNRVPDAVAMNDPLIRDLVQNPTHGTIHCSVLDTHGDMGSVTTTSGLGYKVPGRVGDSPILGAGVYLDNSVGSCGSVGLGELNLLNCASFLAVEFVRQGKTPKDAIVLTAKRIIETCSRNPNFRAGEGKINAGVVFYILTKDGKYAAASTSGPAGITVAEGDKVTTLEAEVIEGLC
jgi:N4-(beta-N-acetylglucosaminyl)-L-asparaginase